MEDYEPKQPELPLYTAASPAERVDPENKPPKEAAQEEEAGELVTVQPVNEAFVATRERTPLEELEERIEIRKARLQEAGNVLYFIVSRATGAVLFFVGACETLVPDLFDLQLEKPPWVFGIGLALLSGKSLGRLILRLPRLMDPDK